MKKMRKLLSLLLVAAMILSFGIVAMAADTGNTASITIKENTDALPDGGTFDGAVYTAYKIFDATIGANGEVAYSTTDSRIVNAINGSGTWSEYFTLTPAEDGKTIVVVKKTMDDATLGQSFADFMYGTVIRNQGNSAMQSTATANYDSTIPGAKFTDLAPGYYLITDTMGSTLIAETLGNETIEKKNTYPTLTKKIIVGTEGVDTINADIGETINFELTLTIPTTVNGSITIVDEAPQVDGKTLMAINAASVRTGTGYTLSGVEALENGNGFTYTLNDPKGMGDSMTIRYTGTLTADAPLDTAIENKAHLVYGNYTSVEDVVTVKTFGIPVKKTANSEEGPAVAGAGFVLKNSDGKYYKETNGIVSWVNTEAEATERVTAISDGVAVVNFNGVKSGTYTLHEKTVPDGYNALAQDVEITVADASPNATTVVNYTGSTLPATGGIGTTIFYVIGGVLVLGAGVVLVSKKRMGAGE